MQSNLLISDKSLFETIKEIDSFSLDDIEVAKEIFKEYLTKGTIYNCVFEDDVWSTSDEYSDIQLYFDINEIEFKKAPVFNTIKRKNFITYLKMFVVGLLGKYVIVSIQTFLRELKEIIRTFDGSRVRTELKLQHPNLALEFLDCIPLYDSNEYDCLVIELEKISEELVVHYTSKSRKLSTFQCYFKFNDLLDDYWNSNITNEERVFYFPIYLWWHITSILPLRPREFLLIPRDCFNDPSVPNKMTFRRNKLKGSKKKVSYNINEDYELCSYEIDSNLAQQVHNYLELTQELPPNNLDTFFRADKHYSFFGRTKRYDSRFFTYANMRYCLSRFYYEIIEQRYKLKIYYSEEFKNDDAILPEDFIEKLNIGDTRHIAMINIIASGGTPTTAMMLAGHSDIDMSSHYYANISTMIECRTYQKYRQSIESGKQDFVLGLNYYAPSITRNRFVEVENGGKCYSELFINGKYDDCLKACGPNGEIGYCKSCTYYRANNYDIFIDDDNLYKNQISKDWDVLTEQINLYRQGKGYEEDVKQALLRLKSSTKTYEKYFVSKLHDGGY